MDVMLIAGVAIFACIATNRLSSGVPALLIFLVVGMLFGSDGLLKIDFDDYLVAEDISTLSLMLIMFYGGFCTNWKSARPVAFSASLLATLGVMLTAAFTALGCYFLLGIAPLESFLIGSVISSTDAASMFSILRSKNLNLQNGLAPLLEVESGSNDPMSFMMTAIALILMEGGDTGRLGYLMFAQVSVGIFFGVWMALAAVYLMKKYDMTGNSFDMVFLVGVVLACYSGASLLDGNGYLSLYIAGMIIGNSRIRNKVQLVHFFNGTTALAQIALFFILGLLALPSSMLPTLNAAVCVMMILVFVARPLAVFAILAPAGYNFRQMLFVSWAGLRGAASVAFAILAVLSTAVTKYDVFHIVFCVALMSVSLQGSTLPWLARRLGLIDDSVDIHSTFNDYQERTSVSLISVNLNEKSTWTGKRISEVELLPGSLVLLVKRGGEEIIPNGSTVMAAGDEIVISMPRFHSEDEANLRETDISASHPWANKTLANAGIPAGTLVAMIKRRQDVLIPNGSTLIMPGDLLVTLKAGKSRK